MSSQKEGPGPPRFVPSAPARIFGAHSQYGPRTLFAIAFGGNGITYSMLGLGLVRAAIEKRKHPLADLFGFGRLQRGR